MIKLGVSTLEALCTSLTQRSIPTLGSWVQSTHVQQQECHTFAGV